SASVRPFAQAASAIDAFWPGDVRLDFRGDFEQTVRAHRFIAANVARKPVRMWYTAPSRDAPPFRSISSTYLWAYVLINEELPALGADAAKTIVPGSRLVLLMRQPAEAQLARAALQRFGFDFTVVARQDFGGERPFIVLVGEVDRIGAPA